MNIKSNNTSFFFLLPLVFMLSRCNSYEQSYPEEIIEKGLQAQYDEAKWLVYAFNLNELGSSIVYVYDSSKKYQEDLTECELNHFNVKYKGGDTVEISFAPFYCEFGDTGYYYTPKGNSFYNTVAFKLPKVKMVYYLTDGTMRKGYTLEEIMENLSPEAAAKELYKVAQMLSAMQAEGSEADKKELYNKKELYYVAKVVYSSMSERLRLCKKEIQLIKHIQENEKRVHPWLRKEAEKRGYLN